MIITRNTATGELIASDNQYERDEQLTKAGWADCDCEDVSDHPVYRQQLNFIRRNDMNGYCILTESVFTPADLADAWTWHAEHS